MAKFARNHWYVAAWSSDIGGKPVGRRLLGEPVVLFRQADQRVAALIDRCPHRLVPLSMGVCVEGHIRCGYHGMEFDGTGRCVHIPAQTVIPPTAHTRSFPIQERYGLVWIWMGDPQRADPNQLPTVEKYSEPGWDMLEGGYQYHPSNYRNIIENLMERPTPPSSIRTRSAIRWRATNPSPPRKRIDTSSRTAGSRTRSRRRTTASA